MKPVKKYIDLVLKLLTDRMPRKVAVSVLVLAGTLLLLIILMPTLGTFHDDTLAENEELTNSIAKLTKSMKTAKDDFQYINDNKTKFDELMRSDRLVPHTRGVATAQLQKLAVQRGLTALTYSFSAASGANAPRDTVTGGYRVQTENVELKLGAPLDTQVMDFIQDLNETFPGAVVLQNIALERAPDVSTEMLNAISRGEDSGTVKGTLGVSWRTAQQDEDKNKKEAPAKRGRK